MTRGNAAIGRAHRATELQCLTVLVVSGSSGTAFLSGRRSRRCPSIAGRARDAAHRVREAHEFAGPGRMDVVENSLALLAASSVRPRTIALGVVFTRAKRGNDVAFADAASKAKLGSSERELVTSYVENVLAGPASAISLHALARGGAEGPGRCLRAQGASDLWATRRLHRHLSR